MFSLSPSLVFVALCPCVCVCTVRTVRSLPGTRFISLTASMTDGGWMDHSFNYCTVYSSQGIIYFTLCEVMMILRHRVVNITTRALGKLARGWPARAH